MLQINEITIEHQKQPLGLDVKRPSISYKLYSNNQNVVQEKCRITVYNSGICVYDSGILQTNQSLLHIYDGKELLPCTEYNVKVWVKDNYGDETCAETKFETGLMLGKDNKTCTKFITHGFKDEERCPVLVKEFKIEKKVVWARIYATSLGVYDLTFNGKRVGDFYFTPYWTNYNKTLEYQTYDVTDFIQKNNKLKMTVADGWYKGSLSWLRKKNCYGDRLSGWLELHIRYEDGLTKKIVTDESWYSTQSEIISSSFYDGEIIDTNAKTCEKKPVSFYDHNLDIILAQQNEPVVKQESFSVKELIVSPKGEKILDFGQNLTGWVEFKYKGKKGQCVVLRYAEILDKYGNLYTDNLRTAKATDVFVCNGKEQIFTPRFTFHGYRYCEVQGIDEIDVENFKSVALYSGIKRNGYFECSDSDINQLYSNQTWSNRCNFLDVPTDCPQRDERLGWTADAMVYSRTACTNFNAYLFFKKWLRDLASEQTKEFGVPQIVPNILEKSDSGNAVWADAATFVPWILYNVYGDKRILEEQYESMCDWVDWITAHTETDGLWKSNFQFGDWLALDMDEFSDRTGATDKYFIANVFYLQSARIVSETAKIFQKDNDVFKYGDLCENLLKQIQNEYFTNTGRMVTETQTACVLALHFNIVPGKFRYKILNVLADDVKKRGHFMTGFVGTPFICFVLTDNGKQELTDLILRREKYPGWIYPIRKGATTMWERWNSIKSDGSFNSVDMNSFNHYAYGSIGEWLYRRLAGIDNLLPAYKKIRIKPIYSKGFYDYSRGTNSASDETKPAWLDGINWVKSSVETPFGTVKCYVDYNTCVLKVEIPVNTTAEIVLPDGSCENVGSGEYEFSFKGGSVNH